MVPRFYPTLPGFDPLSQGFLAGPDEILRQARHDCPAFYIPELEIWAITRYEDVVAAYTDFRTYSSELTNSPAIPKRYVDRVPSDFFPPTNMCMDPPEHTTLRKAANKIFTRPRIAAMDGHIRGVVDELIDSFAADGQCDIVQQFSYPLSAKSSMRLIGIPQADLARFEQLAENLVAVLPYQPGADTNAMSEVEWLGRWDLVMEARDYFGEFVTEREINPRDDLASAFIGARKSDGSPVLSHDQIVTYMLLFIFAGTDTVASFLGLLLVALAEHPDQQAQLISDPSLWPNAVEEGLRRRSSNLGNQRRTTRDVEIDGVTIPQDSTVWLVTASASNDETHFAKPEQFDIHRGNAGDHLAFGLGRHFCMGAPLARLEVPIAIQRLWDRLPGFRVVPDQRLTYDPVFVTLLYNHLQVEWSP